MRAVLRASILLLVAGCTRPVLYYPPGVPRRDLPIAPGSSSASSSASAPVTLGTAAVVEPAGHALTADAAAAAEYLLERHIVMPVAGADPAKLYDSFDDARDGGRTHHAIDILAPRDTPILAADDGRVLRMSSNNLGGITMYTIDSNGLLVYYYAHMDHYNDEMTPGRTIVKGDTLGYVGTTGNAPKDTPHLHFQVMRWPADGKYWDGEPIDPYEALKAAER